MKNLFGKTLVVLIFMFSLILLTMSGAVYMTHTNWRARAEKVTKEVQDAEQQLSGLRQQNDTLVKAIEEEEKLRDLVVAALTAEVENRKAEYTAYTEECKKQDKEIRQNSETMMEYSLFLLKARILADDALVRVQNERNERIRAMHEYVNNMNRIEDLNQQILTLEKRARSLAVKQQPER